MTAPLIIIILAATALLLFAVEAFVTPGIGLAGICAAGCVIAADILTYYTYGTGTAIVALLVSTVVVLLFFWRLGKSKTLERISLHSTINSTAATEAQLSVKPGDERRALTRLALIGNADINGKTVEVKSTGDFINEGTPIVVTSVNEALILVKAR